MRVTIFDNQFEAVDMLPPEEQELFWTSVFRYAFRGQEPDFTAIQSAIFAMMKPALDKSLEGQRNGTLGGDGRGNTRGIKPPLKTPIKTPIKTHVKNPSEKLPKTPTENQKERKSKGKEEKGRVLDTPKVSKTTSMVDGAGGKDPAPPTDIYAVFDEVDALDYEVKNMDEYIQQFNAQYDDVSIPCPDGLNPFKAVV